jgi:hypothetical protein
MRRTRPLSTFVLVSCWIVSSAVAPSPVNAQLAHFSEAQSRTRLTEVLTKDDLQRSIIVWVDLRQAFLQSYFQARVTVNVEQKASEFLIDQYLKRRIAPDKYEDRQLTPDFNPTPDLSRFVVKMDLLTVLERSFEDAVAVRYKSLYNFVKSERPILSIGVPDIEKALEEEDCSIIPCPPDRCNPDCSPKAFRRFLESQGVCVNPPR